MSNESWSMPFGGRSNAWWQHSETTIVTSGTTTVTITTPVPTSIVTDTSSQPPLPTPTPVEPVPTSTGSSHMMSGLTVGQTVGIVIGSVAGVCLLLGLFFLYCWRRKQKQIAQRQTSKIPPATEKVAKHGGGAAGHNQDSAQKSPSSFFGQTRRKWWPWTPRSEGTVVAAPSTNRHPLVDKIRTSMSKSRPVLPISAPIPIDQASIHESFRDRFFRAPAPAPPLPGEDQRTSKVTTIRSSFHPSTPNRRPISLLRTGSRSTSIATSFEDVDKEKPPDVPPIPSFLLNSLSRGPVSGRSSSGKSSPTNVEDGIKRSLRKARSHLPITSRTNKRKINIKPQRSVPALPQARLDALSTNKPSEQGLTTDMLENRPIVDDLEKPVLPLSVPNSPQTPFMIPDRQSSLDKTRATGDEEWLLRDNKKGNTQPKKDKNILPRPLSFRRKRHRSLTPTNRDRECPQIQVAASTDPVNLHDAVMRPLLDSSWYSPGASADDVETRPDQSLEQVVDRTDPLEGPSAMNYAQRQMFLAGEPHKPAENSAIGPREPSPSRSSPQATLTPNRTKAGDLVLLVDL